jgi:hypothetical protein
MDRCRRFHFFFVVRQSNGVQPGANNRSSSDPYVDTFPERVYVGYIKRDDNVAGKNHG